MMIIMIIRATAINDGHIMTTTSDRHWGHPQTAIQKNTAIFANDDENKFTNRLLPFVDAVK